MLKSFIYSGSGSKSFGLTSIVLPSFIRILIFSPSSDTLITCAFSFLYMTLSIGSYVMSYCSEIRCAFGNFGLCASCSGWATGAIGLSIPAFCVSFSTFSSKSRFSLSPCNTSSTSLDFSKSPPADNFGLLILQDSSISILSSIVSISVSDWIIEVIMNSHSSVSKIWTLSNGSSFK